MGTEVNESLILLVETGSKSSLFSRNIGLGWRELKTFRCVTEQSELMFTDHKESILKNNI